MYKEDVYYVLDILTEQINKPLNDKIKCKKNEDCNTCKNSFMPIKRQNRKIFTNENFPKKEYCSIIGDKYSSITMYILISVLAGYFATLFTFECNNDKIYFFILGLLCIFFATILVISRVLFISDIQKVSDSYYSDYRHNDELFVKFMILSGINYYQLLCLGDCKDIIKKVNSFCLSMKIKNILSYCFIALTTVLLGFSMIL